jgi:putative oxidoreductase
MQKRTADIGLLILRVIAGAIFLPHGYSKVFGSGGVAAFAHDMPGFGLPLVLGYVAAYSEFFGAILLILGLLSRLDAFLLACIMFVAVAFVQLPDALHEAQPGSLRLFAVIRGVEMPLSLLGATLALTLLGPGRFSLDHALGLEQKIVNLVRRSQ